MSAEAELSCPVCNHRMGSLDWHTPESGSCRNCLQDFTFIPFPELLRPTAVAKPQAVAIAEDSTCFFHVENQAEKVCEGCGRFLCAVCAVPFAGKVLCPTCIAATSKHPSIRATESTLWSGIALSVAILPLLIWPFTLISAPITLGIVVHGWNKPGSLVRSRQRWKMILAALVAVIEIGLWIFVGLKLWLR